MARSWGERSAIVFLRACLDLYPRFENCGFYEKNYTHFIILLSLFLWRCSLLLTTRNSHNAATFIYSSNTVDNINTNIFERICKNYQYWVEGWVNERQTDRLCSLHACAGETLTSPSWGIGTLLLSFIIDRYPPYSLQRRNVNPWTLNTLPFFFNMYNWELCLLCMDDFRTNSLKSLDTMFSWSGLV